MTTISDIAEFIGTTTDKINSIWGNQIVHLTMNSVKTGNGTRRKYTRSAFTIWKDKMGDKLDGKTRAGVMSIWSDIDQTKYNQLASFEKKTLLINSPEKPVVKKKGKCCYGSDCDSDSGCSDYDSDSDCSDCDSDSDCSDCSDCESDCESDFTDYCD